MSAENTPNWNGADDRRRSTDMLAMTSLGGAVEWPNDAEQPDAPVRPNARRRSPGGPVRFILLALLALLALALAGASGGLYYLNRSFDGKIYPNISVRGLAIGEMTPDQALGVLNRRYAPFLQQPVGIAFGDQVWHPTLAELGARLELGEAVQTAFDSGRHADTATNLWQVAAIWQRGIELPLHLTLDQTAMQRYLASHAAVDQPARDAQLVFNGTSASTTPSRNGRQVLFAETMQELTAALQTLEPQQVALRTREQRPLLGDEETLKAQQTIEAMLRSSITITAEKQQYELTVDDVSRMIRITRVPDPAGDRLVVAIDHTPIKRRIWTIAEETGIGSVNPRVDWNNGNLKIISPGKPGMRIDAAAAETLIANAIMASQPVVTLPFKQVEPIADQSSLQALGINELVSVGRSDFTGSAAYRITNIEAGMRLLHGVLIPPDEEFSFNDTVGNIDASNGFVEGHAIVENRTQIEFGGGICQDSTTVFRAAFWAGLPITERKEHSFYINWYDKYGLGEQGNGPGLDATIFTGAQDFKFRNDTGHWLLLQTVVDEKHALAEVRLYGTKPNRTVSLTARRYDEKPMPPQARYLPDSTVPRGTRKQSDKGRGGFTVDVYRTIVENGVKRSPELFRTRFQPWPNIYLYNPADLAPNGRPLPRPEPPLVDPNQPAADPSQPAPFDPNRPWVDPAQPTIPPADPGQPPLTEQPAQPAPPA